MGHLCFVKYSEIHFLGAWHKHPWPAWHSYPEEAMHDYTPYLGDSDVICLKGWCQVWYTRLEVHAICRLTMNPMPRRMSIRECMVTYASMIQCFEDETEVRLGFQRLQVQFSAHGTGTHWRSSTHLANLRSKWWNSWNMLKLCALDTVHVSIEFCNDALPQCTCKELHHMKCRVISNGRQALDRMF